MRAATSADSVVAVQVASGEVMICWLRCGMNERTLKILARAEAAGDLKTALIAIREVRGNHELRGRMLGELESRQTTQTANIQVHFDEPIQITCFIALTGRFPTAKERREILDGAKLEPEMADLF